MMTITGGGRDHAFENDRPLPPRLGRFEVRDVLGKDSVARVCRARDPLLDRDVSVRVRYRGGARRGEQPAWLLRWGKAAALLRHPNIAPVYEAGVDANHDYVVSALVEGKTLEQVAAQTRLEFATAARLVMDLATALSYAHRMGFVHGDLRLARVFVDANGDPVLTDFGAARLDESANASGPDCETMGAPADMPAEPAAASKNRVGQAADQYGLGVMFYELLCGRAPCSGRPAPRKINRRIPKDLEAVCLKALAQDPRRRYADCQELAADLRRWLNDQPVQARRPGGLERGWRWCRQHRSVALLSAAAVVVLTLIGAFMTMGSVRTSRALANEALLRQRAETLQGQVESDLRRAELERHRAQAQRDQAEQALQRARAQRAQAEQERKRAEAARAAEAKQLQLAETERQRAEDILARATQQQRQADIQQKNADAASNLAQNHEESNRIAQVLQSLTVLVTHKQGMNDGAAGAESSRSPGLADGNRSADDKQFAEIMQSLDAIPIHSRHWEWGYLKRQCERNQSHNQSHNESRNQSRDYPRTPLFYFQVHNSHYANHETLLSRVVRRFGVHLPESVVFLESKDWPVERQDEPVSVVSSKDGQWATATRRGEISLWKFDGPGAMRPDIVRFTRTSSWRIPYGVADIAFSPDSKQIVSANQNKTVQLWDI